jgi:predicted amidophosphoribosyltransferase
MEPSAISKECPNCHKLYTQLENYCSKCGISLVKNKNRCSEFKTTLCESRVYADDDVFCVYCGSLTTYAKELQAQQEKLKEVFNN